MHTLSRFARRVAAFVYTVLVLQPHVSHAQQLALTQTYRPTVSRAADFISTPAMVKVNSDLKFVRLDTDEAKKISRARLQVRIFSLRDGESVPSESTKIKDCNVYYSTIYTINPSDSREIIVTKTNAAWLSLSTTGHSFDSGRYFLVIESIGADDRIFRLKAGDAKEYFAQGFLLTVEPDGNVPLQLVRQMHEKREADAVMLIRRISDTSDAIPCYQYSSHKTVITEAEADKSQGELLACR